MGEDRPRRAGVVFDVDGTLLDELAVSAIGRLADPAGQAGSADQP